MKLFLLIVLSIVFSISALASDCNDYQVKIIFDRKAVITKEILCSQKSTDNMIFYVSKNCFDKKCEILKRKKIELIIKDYTSNLGSPGFRLCSELGGIPQIFEFTSTLANLWQSTERCLFEKDFVEISLLTKEWKNYIKK